jgi:hypothetical protein
MTKDTGASPTATGLSQQAAEPEVSALRASIPSAVRFNVNEYVRVKLTECGLKLLREDHARWKALYPSSFGEFTPPKTDADGWSEWQLWCLMARFGEYITMGMTAPFETEIEFKLPASAIEARSDATGTGAAEGESAVGEAETPKAKA